MDRMLSVEIMTKLETPSPRQGRMMPGTSFIFRTRSFSVVFFPVRNFRIQTALTAWLSTVAMAAPRTPSPNPNIRMGSSTILHTAPMATVSIPVLAKPWAVIKAFMPRVSCTKMVPMA